ncbi:MAG: hypothetical protein WAV48_01920 [Candidatus Magasanikiibacteriota bacterium]
MRNLEQLLDEIRAKAEAGVITRESLEALLANSKELVAGGQTGVYTVVIDYGKTVEQMKKDGRYNWSNDNISSRNFPVSGTGTANVTLELVHLNKAASSKDVLSHMEANGLRAATVEELLMFGATYPDVQREFPIVCLGSSWVDPDGSRFVPFLDRYVSDRGLRLYWFGLGWNDVCRFLAVRKSV